MTRATPPPDHGIRLSNAGVVLFGRTILTGVSLHMTEARIGIVGRNGSGKSTLLRLMAGLIAPTSGSVTLNGFDPFTDRKATLHALGILFQNPDHQILFPTVIEELSFGLTQMGASKADATARSHSLLALHNREGWADAPTSTLSQGQRHWLCLMAVLLMEPATILLDEPLAGLDLPSQSRLTRAFATLPQRLITISHDPAVMEAQTRVLWLDQGEIRADGPPDAILPAFRAEMHRLGDADADTDLTC